MGMHGIWFEEAFYFGTGKKTRKAKNLAENPRCIIINDQIEELAIVEGIAEIIAFADLPKGASEATHKKYGWPCMKAATAASTGFAQRKSSASR